jgi:hypothetical protein
MTLMLVASYTRVNQTDAIEAISLPRRLVNLPGNVTGADWSHTSRLRSCASIWDRRRRLTSNNRPEADRANRDARTEVRLESQFYDVKGRLRDERGPHLTGATVISAGEA